MLHINYPSIHGLESTQSSSSGAYARHLLPQPTQRRWCQLPNHSLTATFPQLPELIFGNWGNSERQGITVAPHEDL